MALAHCLAYIASLTICFAGYSGITAKKVKKLAYIEEVTAVFLDVDGWGIGDGIAFRYGSQYYVLTTSHIADGVSSSGSGEVFLRKFGTIPVKLVVKKEKDDLALFVLTSLSGEIGKALTELPDVPFASRLPQDEEVLMSLSTPFGESFRIGFHRFTTLLDESYRPGFLRKGKLLIRPDDSSKKPFEFSARLNSKRQWFITETGHVFPGSSGAAIVSFWTGEILGIVNYVRFLSDHTREDEKVALSFLEERAIDALTIHEFLKSALPAK